MSAMGNARANAFWEAQLPPDFRRPPDNDMSLLRVFITDKYVAKRYADPAFPQAPNIDSYSTHPVSQGRAGRAGEVRPGHGQNRRAGPTGLAAARPALPCSAGQQA